MFSTKLAQTLQSSSRLLRTVSIPEGRAFFASKPAGSPSGESGRDVRDAGTQKVNVPVGQATKKADKADDKLSGKGAGAVSQRGHEEVSGGKPSGDMKNQQAATNYQQKRSFTISGAVNAEKRPQNISKQDNSNDNQAFVSDEAKKNINPGTQSESQTGGFKNLEFYPEKSGSAPFDPSQQSNSRSSASSNNQHHYDTRENPSKSGKDAEAKYMDEAMTSKSGPLTEDQSTQNKPGKGWKDNSSQSGKRSFSTSTAAWTVTPAGKNSSHVEQPAGQGGAPAGKDAGIRGTERQRTGDDMPLKEGRGKKTPPSIDVSLGEISTGKDQSQTVGGKRTMATSSSSSQSGKKSTNEITPGPGTKKAVSIGNAEFGGEDHKGGDDRAQHAEFESQEERVEIDREHRGAPSIRGVIETVKEAVTGAKEAVAGSSSKAKSK